MLVIGMQIYLMETELFTFHQFCYIKEISVMVNLKDREEFSSLNKNVFILDKFLMVRQMELALLQTVKTGTVLGENGKNLNPKAENWNSI